MSREEAIEILSEMRAEYNLFGEEEEATRYHVLSWAIQAMKDTQMGDLIDRKETIRAWCKLTCGCEPEECGMTIERDGAEECNFVEFLWNRPEYEYERDNEFVPVKRGRWIPVSEGLPEEHESIWAKVKGTDRWSEAMWEKQSDEVIVTELFEDGTTRTDTACTHDGEWYVKIKAVKRKIIAWMPLPKPWEGEEDETD